MSSKTTTDKEAAAVEARIQTGGPFTYMGLCGLVENEAKTRTADRTIQRYRRQGLIAFQRIKGQTSPIWSLTEAGRKAFGGDQS